jgi:DNA repair protein RadC
MAADTCFMQIARHWAMRIKDWPEQDRPREKLLKLGAGALSDSELLALFIGNGSRERDAVESARLLLDLHGPLRRLLDMDAASLKKLPALGPARACKLVAALELANRHLKAQLDKGDSMRDPVSAARYFKQRLRSRPQEVFAALFLDTRNRTLAYEELFTGTIDAAAVYPREVVRRALLHNAAAVIVSHNHPSGSAEPSAADRQITRHLQQALDLVGIRLLDHVVVGEGTPVSMAERGWLEPTLSFRG